MLMRIPGRGKDLYFHGLRQRWTKNIEAEYIVAANMYVGTLRAVHTLKF